MLNSIVCVNSPITRVRQSDAASLRDAEECGCRGYGFLRLRLRALKEALWFWVLQRAAKNFMYHLSPVSYLPFVTIKNVNI